ncbi:MAG: radical SAM protein, partial [Phycisphaerales bacterium]|nr:radical SAM protein [Phycisphaerales bacterium]
MAMNGNGRIDVLIVNPPSPDGHIYIRDVCRWGRRSRERMIWPQTSLAYLAAMVPDEMSVEIIDAIAEQMTWREFEARVRDKRPSFYVSYVTGTTFDIDARGIQVAKQEGAMTIAVGTHPSAVPRNTLELIPDLDVVIRHEPELTFREVLDRTRAGRPLTGCKGTAIRDDRGEIAVHEDRPLLENLDDLPIPKQHLLPLDRYRMPFIGKRYVWLLTNRGCPYRCTYCFEGVIWGKSVRYRSAESIIQEIEYLARHDVHKVVFLADLFTFDRQGVLRLCDLILAKGLKLKWACNSRVDTIDREMATKMKQAGCWLIALGLESGSQSVLDACKKDAKIEKAAETVAMLHQLGIRTWGYFIIGLPGETEATIRETIDFAKTLPLDIALFHVAVPYAGTEFYFQAVANGWLNTN